VGGQSKKLDGSGEIVYNKANVRSPRVTEREIVTLTYNYWLTVRPRPSAPKKSRLFLTSGFCPLYPSNLIFVALCRASPSLPSFPFHKIVLDKPIQSAYTVHNFIQFQTVEAEIKTADALTESPGS